ncbi:MAG: response regulator [Microcoleaceae cyanobacterium]
MTSSTRDKIPETFQAKVLVIDDNPTNLRVAVHALEDSGFTVLIASSGEIGIKRAKYARPDIILLDIQMPGINGFETCRQLKSYPETKGIPVIFMTALTNPEDKVMGFEVGAIDYITKPIEIREVLARVNLHLKLNLLSKTLEQQVEQRTVELNQALTELQNSHLQLVQREKMSALGQLMAGITHEINNPIGFVSGNLNCAGEYITDLIEHLQLYQKYLPALPKEIKQHSEEIELDYLLEDLPEILESMKSGMDRMRAISTSMRIFSRADQEQKVAFNLHEGIDSTLLILKHRLKARDDRPEIKIVKYYGQIDEVEGFPGQLNQVFMNLVANAIEVFDEMSEFMTAEQLKNCSFQIQILTEINSDQTEIIIRIKDNGKGMTEAVRGKIFAPSFTTKPVGKGTGLGLSISHQIIEEKHGGKISCNSQPGEGTEFVIRLPLIMTGEMSSR